LAFVIDAAGGKGTTGELILEETSNNNTNSSNKNISNNLLDVALPTIDVDTAADDDVDGQQHNQQQRVLLHDRISVFLGSKNDIDDLLSYGDVRQIV
jgi:fructose-1,6-bisphosphatase